MLFHFLSTFNSTQYIFIYSTTMVSRDFRLLLLTVGCATVYFENFVTFSAPIDNSF